MIDQAEMHSLFEATDNVTYLLSSDLRIIRTSPAWESFARANGGEQLLAQWSLGSSLLAVIPDVLKPFFVDGFARARETGERWDHDYECSSPDERRFYRMLVYPSRDELVVTHALIRTTPHAHAAQEYAGGRVMAMCAHCRRVRAEDSERWDWIPAYVVSLPPNTSHGLCQACYAHYYP